MTILRRITNNKRDDAGGSDSEGLDPPVPLQQAGRELVSTDDAATLRQILTDYSALLDSGFDSFLTRRLQKAWGKGVKVDKINLRDILACRAFLARCREQGVEAVLAGSLTLPLGKNCSLGQLMELSYGRADLSRRINLIRRVLADVRQTTEPDLWASLQRDLGDYLAQSEEENRAEHLDEALKAYRAALEIWDKLPRELYKQARAQTMHNMATTLRRQIKSVEKKRGDNFNQSIELYQKVLKICTKDRFPNEWAETQQNLGNAWMETPVGNSIKNVEKGIVCYKNALSVRTRQKKPSLWAETTHNLALAYSEHPGSNRLENLEKAIELYTEVLQVRTPQRHPLEWAQSQMDLGNAYVMRLKGGRMENLEEAIEHYQEALNILSPKKQMYPADWARACYDLAVAYVYRLKDGKATNLHQAIEYYQRALRVYTKKRYPREWAQVNTGLGCVYRQPELEDRANNLEIAIKYFEDALMVRTREDDPIAWATLQSSLGNVYADRVMGNRIANQRKALACYQNALQIRTRETTPSRWAETMNNMGTVYIELLSINPLQNQKKAIACLNEALKVHKPHTFPNDSRRTARNLANLIFFAGRWPEAHAAYTTAIEAAEVLYNASFMEAGREAEIGENATLYINDAFCLAHMKKLKEAVVRLEQGKTRILAGRLARDAVQLQQANSKDQEVYRDLVDRLKGLEAEQRTSSEGESLTGSGRPYSRIADEVKQVRQDLDNVVERIHSYLPDFRPDPLDFAAIQALVPDKQTALVEFCVTGQGSMILVVGSHGKPEVVWIKAFTHLHLQGIVGAWMAAYRNKDKAGWKKAIEQVLNELGTRLIAPLCKTLNKKDITRLILVPQGSLFLLPLHAIPLGEDGDCLLDHYEISYAPSATVLQRCRERARPGPAQKFFAAVNPTGDFAYAGSEVPAIKLFFNSSEALWRDEATKDRILTECKGYDYVHFCCHGQYDWNDPFRSVLLLAGGFKLDEHGNFQQDEAGNPVTDYEHALTLTEVETNLDLKQTRLVTLPACETGLTQATGPRAEEYVGLPAGFLLAGVPAVVAPLWAVYEVSTTLLMERFYKNHLCGDPDDKAAARQPLPAAEALRRAQIWLRDQVTVKETASACQAHIDQLRSEGKNVPVWLSKRSRWYAQKAKQTPEYHPYAHPFYWAAFSLSGVVENANNKLKGDKQECLRRLRFLMF